MTFYPLPTISIRIVFVYVLGNAYILESDIDIVRCCGLISTWTFYPINKGSLKFVVWRSIGVDGYREVVGTNSVNVSGKIVQNSYHGYRKVVGTNSVNVSGKIIPNSYHGYRKVVSTNSVNVSGKIV
jgi:hypothetical protein